MCIREDGRKVGGGISSGHSWASCAQHDCKFVKTNANEQSMYLLYTANIARLVIFSMYVMWNMKMDQMYVK